MYTIKEWRRLRGFTQTDLAEKVGRSKLTIIKWEKGETEPKWSELTKLAEVLNTNGIDNIRMLKSST